MKKILFLLTILAITGFAYFHFSAPKVLERRLDSSQGTMSFGTLNFGDMDKEADKFASHFAA